MEKDGLISPKVVTSVRVAWVLESSIDELLTY